MSQRSWNQLYSNGKSPDYVFIFMPTVGFNTFRTFVTYRYIKVNYLYKIKEKSEFAWGLNPHTMTTIRHRNICMVLSTRLTKRSLNLFFQKGYWMVKLESVFV